MDRREFLRWTGWGSLITPSVLTCGLRVWAGDRDELEKRLPPTETTKRWDRMLVLVELQGGNDGLNTIVPFADDAYYQKRPRLAIPREQVLPLDDTLGLHPALEPLLATFEAGQLAVVNGVGYDQPNRSHFRSIEIWETGSDSDEYREQGWLAGLFSRATLPAGRAADSIILGGNGKAGPLEGKTMRNIAMEEPRAFIAQAKRLGEVGASGKNPALAHLVRVRSHLQEAAALIEAKLENAKPLEEEFPRTRFGRQLEVAARLLVSGVPTLVVKLTLGGFDTHTGQAGPHRRLLGELSSGLAAFGSALRRAKLWDRVLVMTYSEFGRRVAQNGSQGTDHGTAAPQLLMGGKVRGGLYGRQPSLTDLRGGDLEHHVDYRSLYATVATEWWKLPAKWLENGKYPPLAGVVEA